MKHTARSIRIENLESKSYISRNKIACTKSKRKELNMDQKKEIRNEESIKNKTCMDCKKSVVNEEGHLIVMPFYGAWREWKDLQKISDEEMAMAMLGYRCASCSRAWTMN